MSDWPEGKNYDLTVSSWYLLKLTVNSLWLNHWAFIGLHRRTWPGWQICIKDMYQSLLMKSSPLFSPKCYSMLKKSSSSIFFSTPEKSFEKKANFLLNHSMIYFWYVFFIFIFWTELWADKYWNVDIVNWDRTFEFLPLSEFGRWLVISLNFSLYQNENVGLKKCKNLKSKLI